MRVDNLRRRLDSWIAEPSPIPAEQQYRDGTPGLTGAQVASSHPLLLHYTQTEHLITILHNGGISTGAWLSPSSYTGCMCPYDLGLPSPRDVVLVVEAARLDQLWGPGTSGPSDEHPELWRGGGLEYFVPGGIPLGAIADVLAVDPCGDEHR